MEAETTLFPLGVVVFLFVGIPFILSCTWSVGVGGMMVVVGASDTVLAIDLGDVAICGRLWTL